MRQSDFVVRPRQRVGDGLGEGWDLGLSETTERYPGSRQRVMDAVNDKMDIEPQAAPG